MSVSTISAPDGTQLVVPDGVDDLADDDIDRLRHDGVVEQSVGGSLSVTWAFWKPQVDAFRAVYSGDYDIVGLVGGFRSGKSVTGARATWQIALDDSFGQTRSLAMGKTYAEAKKTTYPVLFEQLPGAPAEKVDPFLYDGDPTNSPVIKSWSKQDGILTTATDSTVILASADKSDRYDGGSFSFAWCDEFAHYDTDKIHGIRKTVTERFDFGPPKVMLVTTTGNGLNPAHDILERRVDAYGNPIGQSVNLITASSLNNPFLTADDKARLRRTHGQSKQSEQALHGAFESAEGQVFPFSRQAHVVDLVQTDDGGYTSVDDDGNPTDRVTISDTYRIYGYDAGWSDPRVLLEIARSSYGQYVVVDEFYESGTHVADAIRWLGDGSKPSGRIYCEHEPGDIRKFRKPALTNIDDPPSGYPAGKAEKDIDAGIDEVKHRLRADHEDRYGLLVSTECENLISELLSYTEDDVGAKDADDHAVDSLRYAIYTDSLRGSSSGSSGSTVSKR